MTDALYRMSPVEIARGTLVGFLDPSVASAGDTSSASTPREALEACVLEALDRRPTVVAFSGGRDSSALLAVAVLVARRHGLDLPVPVTRRYPGIDGTNEDSWQELMVRHLGLREWVRIEIDDGRLDLIGPIAAPRLRRFGVLWPPLLYTDAAIVEVARGGTIINGEGGDQLLVAANHRMPRLLSTLGRGRRVPGPRSIMRAGMQLAPKSIRAREARRRVDESVVSWLRPEVHRGLIDDVIRDEVSMPLRFDRSIRAIPQQRSLVHGLDNRRHLAAMEDVRYAHPFLDHGFIDSLARSGGWWGRASRSRWMTELFGDILPPAIIQRHTKAAFNLAVHGRHSRAFAASWDGSGVDADLIDVDALRRAWLSDYPPAMSAALLQAAWLAGTAHRDSTHSD